MHLMLVLMCVFISACNCENTGADGTVLGGSENKTKIIITEPTNKSTNFTSTEIAALNKFRPLVPNIVRDEDKTDQSLIRWLRARDLDVSKALEMLRAALKWRKESKIDTIRNETIFDFRQPQFIIEGFDKEGHPIIIIKPTAFDFRKMGFQGTNDKLYRYVIQTAERALARRSEGSALSGREINQIFGILDFHGFNLRQHGCLSCVPTFIEIFYALENYYPDVFRHLVAVNVPRIALPLIEILKAVLSQRTLKAVQVFPPDKKLWSKYLTQFIAPDELPRRYGGTRSD